MAQHPTRPCIQCGTPLALNQGFCTNCGARQNVAGTSNPGMTPGGSNPNMGPYAPPPAPPYQQNIPPQQQGMPPNAYGGYQNYQQQNYQQVPTYAQSQQPNGGSDVVTPLGALLGLLLLRRAGRRARSGFIGCLVWIVILVALGLCGLFAYHNYGSSLTSSSSGQDNYGSTSNIKKITTPVNENFTYSGVAITVIDAQQAPAFSDDSNSAQNGGILRLDLKEQTGAINDESFSYTESFQLVGSDGTTINASNAENGSAPPQSVSRTNWVDFPLASNIDVSKYTLRVGTANEAQMNIPLTGKADLTAYQPKSIQPNKNFTYGGVDFTLTKATAELSANGPQAPKGMMYVIVDLNINNNSSNTFYGDLTKYRLTAGSTTNPNTNAGSEPNVQTGQTNQTMELIFTMPQGSTQFTLAFLPSSSNNATNQVNVPIQIS